MDGLGLVTHLPPTFRRLQDSQNAIPETKETREFLYMLRRRARHARAEDPPVDRVEPSGFEGVVGVFGER